MEQPQKPPHQDSPTEAPVASLWTQRRRPWIVGLIFMLLAGNFFFQIQTYLLGGGLVLPVLAGQILGIFVPLLLIFRRNGWNPLQDLDLHQVPWPLLAATVILAGASLVPTSFLAEMSMRLFPGDPERIAAFQEALPRSALGVLLTGLTVILVGPLGEEIVFRGLLHRLASDYWDPIKASLLSSLVFALVHAEPWLVLGLVGVGAALAFLYETTRSLTVCFVYHAAHNALALTLMYTADEIPTGPQPIETMDFVWLGISLLVWGVLARWLMGMKKARHEP